MTLGTTTAGTATKTGDTARQVPAARPSLEALLTKAARGGAEGFAALYTLLGTLADGTRPLKPDQVAQVLALLQVITGKVELTVRRALAEQLADNPQADHDLILMLANDAYGAAEPVLAQSPVLSAEDLIAIIRTRSHDHARCIARRPDLSEAVSDAIVERGLSDDAEEAADLLYVLLENADAVISGTAFARLSEIAKSVNTLQRPLVAREDLPEASAVTLFGWVSGALKKTIQQRYQVSEQDLASSIREARRAHLHAATGNEAPTPRAHPDPQRFGTDPQPPKPAAQEPEAPMGSAQRLVEKLHRAGHLKASFLLKALHQGQEDLFRAAFAKLIDLQAEQMRRVLEDLNGRPLALACRAAGIDRSVFQTVRNLGSGGSAKPLPSAERAAVEDAFAMADKTAAKAELLENLAKAS